jgi:hypothetical protein
MKKQIAKKIALSKDTLRNLSEREMEGIVGGNTFTRLCCSGGVSSCCTDDCTGSCGACSDLSSCC